MNRRAEVTCFPLAERQPYREIVPGDEEWPLGLSELQSHAPPKSLYVTGAKLRSHLESVSIVGSRRPTVAGLEAARRIAAGVAEAGWTVVSGLAMGIDAAAHKAALEVGGSTVAVLGCGLDVNYPVRNERLRKRIDAEGTVVTEYGFGVPPVDFHFPERNRIIVGLSHYIVFVEGTRESGGMITARIGLEENRNIFAVPGSIRNAMAEGPNKLIRTSQAGLATESRHLFEDLPPELVWEEREDEAPGPVPELNDEEAAVLMILDDAPATIDELSSQADIPSGRASLALSRLEVRGFAARRRGLYFVSSAGARVRRALARTSG